MKPNATLASPYRRCEICGHEWTIRVFNGKVNDPKRCPKADCRSPHWKDGLPSPDRHLDQRLDQDVNRKDRKTA